MARKTTRTGKRAEARSKEGDAQWFCVQRARRLRPVPGITKIRAWVEASLRGPLRRRPPPVTVRLVGLAEGRRLNETYRHREGATNVLAFPGAANGRELGDIVICVPVLSREARAQGTPPAAHLAHLVIHGMLHLQGFSHERPGEARRMERCEVQILRRMGFSSPYDQ
jgi:probable rRNA maturation factor